MEQVMTEPQTEEVKPDEKKAKPKKEKVPLRSLPPVPQGHEIYHVGFLAIDRDLRPDMSKRQRQRAVELSHTADWWWALSLQNKATIYQRRLGPFVFEYVGALNKSIRETRAQP
jgi:hypothetical protein